MDNERSDLSGQGGPAVTVRYRFWREARFDVMEHQIGPDGVFVRTPEPFAPGTEVEFEVSSSRSAGPLRGRARVTSVRDRDQATSEQPPGMRIRFLGFEDPAAARATRARFRAACEAGGSPEPEARSAPPPRSSVPDEQLDRWARSDRGPAPSGRADVDVWAMDEPPLPRDPQDDPPDEEEDPFFADRRRRLRRAVTGVLVAAAALVVAAIAGSLTAAPGRAAPTARAEATAPVRSPSASALTGAGAGAPAAPLARDARAPAVATAPPQAVAVPAAAEPAAADAPASGRRGAAKTSETSKARGPSRPRPRPAARAADIYD